MAVITQLNQNDPNKDPNQQDQQTGAANIPMVGGTQGSSIAATGQQPSGNAAGAPQVGSGRFTNLQSYLNANQGSGAKIAGKIGENVQKSADDTNKAVQATGAVQSQLDAEKNRIAQASGFAQQVNTDPNAIASNDQSLNAFTQLRNGTNAADSINSIAQNKLTGAQSALSTLQQNAANTATETGRFQLLQQALGRPSYNQGQQRLDQLLVQNGGGNVLNNLQKTAQTTAADANKALATTNSALNTGVADVKSQATAAQQQLLASLGKLDTSSDLNDGSGALGSLQDQLQGRVTDFDAKNQATYDQLMKEKGGNQFTSDVANQLGIKDGQQLFDVDVNNLVQPTWSAGNVNQQNIASSDDVARYNALAKLAGVDPSYLTASQAGTAQGVQVDPSALQSALASRQSQYDSLMGSSTAQNLPSILQQYANSRFTNPAVRAALANGQYTPQAAVAAINALKQSSPAALAAAIQTQGGVNNDGEYLYGQEGLDNIMRTYQLYNFANQYTPFNAGNIATIKDPNSATAVNDNTFGVK